jgi:hypothetical protein
VAPLSLHPSGLPIVPVTVSTTTPKVEVHENSDAVLSCDFRTEKEQNPRIEWKKKGTDVSFVYYEGHFRGDWLSWHILFHRSLSVSFNPCPEPIFRLSDFIYSPHTRGIHFKSLINIKQNVMNITKIFV